MRSLDLAHKVKLQPPRRATMERASSKSSDVVAGLGLKSGSAWPGTTLRNGQKKRPESTS